MSGEAFLVGGVRTPFGRHRGALATVRPDDLAALVVQAALERASVPVDSVDEVILGAANQAGEDNRNVARMAVLLAGLPDTVPGYTVNRLCASSLQAVVSAAHQIRAGEADVVVAGGVESMTRAPMVVPKPDRPWGGAAEIADTTLGWRLVNPRMRELDGGKATITLGDTAEEVAILDGITREESDAFGLRSQQLTAAAAAFHAEDLVEVATGKTTVTADEVPRPDTTAEALAALKPAFRPDGIITAGTASPLSDGAGAIVVASERAVEKLGLAPRARVVSAASAGVPPHIMGLGPVPSTELVLERAGWSVGRPRRGRDQRSVRAAGDRERQAPRPRRGHREHGGRRHRARTSARRQRRPPRADAARPARAPERSPRPRHPLHRRRPGPGRPGRAGLGIPAAPAAG